MESHSDISDDILAIHGLSSLHDIGKATGVKADKKRCYMTECRVKTWRSKTGMSGASSVKLCSIPPTTETFTENMHRCHLQVAIWKAAFLGSPPEIDSTKYGWELDHLGILVPRTMPSGTLFAPPDILQLTDCNCKASGCRTTACSCAKIGCMIFCLCEGA